MVLPRPVVIGGGLVLLVLVVTTLGMVAMWPTKGKVDRLIDERLASRGLVPLPSPPESSSPAPSASASGSASAPKPKGNAVAESLAFLARLDELMKDYTPQLPVVEEQVVEDRSDMLRCVTTDGRSKPEFQQLASKMKKMADATRKRTDAAEAERSRKESEFYNSLYPLAYHYDLDWRTRMTQFPAVFGCYQSQYAQYPAGWADATQEACKALAANFDPAGPAVFVWKVRTPARPSVFLHSGTEVAPIQPPELMRRMEAANVQLLPRFSCRVEDVVPEPDHKTVKCNGSSTLVASLRISGDMKAVNTGDVVSVPLAGTKRDPDGVLFKNNPRKKGVWVVDADGPTLTVDAVATCPSLAEIQASISNGGK